MVDDEGRADLFADRAGPVEGRAALVELVDAALREPDRGPLAVMVLRPNDLHFLDSCGCYDGEAMLRELTGAIASSLRGADRFARLGEATFAVLTTADRQAAVRLTGEIMFVIESPSHRHLPLSVSAGIVLAPPDATEETGAELVRRASIALGAVTATPWGIAVFAPAMTAEHSNHRRLHTAITHGSQEEEATDDIDVLFEPMVDLASGRTVGVAARAAWYEADHTVIPAGRLMTLARYAGLAGRVDEFVMQTALSSFADGTVRRPDGGEALWITLCTETLSDPDFPYRLRQLLSDVGVAPRLLVVDPLDDLYQGPHVQAARRSVQRLRTFGVQVSAANAMAMLENGSEADGHAASADYLSISPTTVERCVVDPRARELVRAAVRFAADHQVGSAARQVVTAEQHAVLRDLGCRLARGPFYGEPRLADRAGDLVTGPVVVA